MAISQERPPEAPANPAERQPPPPGTPQLPPVSDEQAPSAGMSVLHMFLWLRKDNRAMREENSQRHDETNRRLDETNRRLDDLREESNQRHEENMKRFHRHDKMFWGVYAFIAVFFVSGPGPDGFIGQLLLSLLGAR